MQTTRDTHFTLCTVTDEDPAPLVFSRLLRPFTHRSPCPTALATCTLPTSPPPGTCPPRHIFPSKFALFTNQQSTALLSHLSCELSFCFICLPQVFISCVVSSLWLEVWWWIPAPAKSVLQRVFPLLFYSACLFCASADAGFPLSGCRHQ